MSSAAVSTAAEALDAGCTTSRSLFGVILCGGTSTCASLGHVGPFYELHSSYGASLSFADDTFEILSRGDSLSFAYGTVEILSGGDSLSFAYDTVEILSGGGDILSAGDSLRVAAGTYEVPPQLACQAACRAAGDQAAVGGTADTQPQAAAFVGDYLCFP